MFKLYLINLNDTYCNYCRPDKDLTNNLGLIVGTAADTVAGTAAYIDSVEGSLVVGTEYCMNIGSVHNSVGQHSFVDKYYTVVDRDSVAD